MGNQSTTTLTIDELPVDVRDHLTLLAAKSGRSLAAEARAILEADMRSKNRTPAEVAKRIHDRFQRIGGVEDFDLPARPAPAEPPEFA